MKLRYWLIIFLVFNCLSTSKVFAEYGILPIDNQIEQQLFQEGIMSTGGPGSMNVSPYESVKINETTLTIVLTPFGKSQHRDLETMRALTKARVNQLYQMAGSTKRIYRVKFYYQGKELLGDTLVEENSSFKKIDMPKLIEKMREPTSVISRDEEKTFNPSSKELLDSTYTDRYGQQYTNNKQYRVYYKNGEIIAIVSLDENISEGKCEYGKIPDGLIYHTLSNSSIDIDNDAYYDKENLSEIDIVPYKQGKRNGWEKEYDKEGNLTYQIHWINGKWIDQR